MSARPTLVLAAALLVVSCSEQHYTIRADNQSSEELSDVRVWYGDLMTAFGYLGPSVYKANSFIRHPPPDVAEVSWTDSRGRAHKVTVDISDLVSRKYDQGVLTFVIHADQTVTAGFFIAEKLPFEKNDY